MRNRTFESVTYGWLDYELTLEQVEMLKTRYTLDAWDRYLSKVSMSNNRYAEERLISWLDLYR
jgi:hypothetical protein